MDKKQKLKLKKSLKNELHLTDREVEEEIERIEEMEEEQEEYYQSLESHFAEILRKYRKEQDPYDDTLSNSFEIPIARLIQDEGKLSLKDVIKKTGLSRQTAINNLKTLTKNGYLSRQSLVKGRGRPTILYYRTQKPINILKFGNAVTLSFQKLKHVCRLEKGGFCKQKKCHCSPNICPIVIKRDF